MVIDIHAHFTPPAWLDELRRNGAEYGCAVREDSAGHTTVQLGDENPAPVLPRLLDLPARLRAMEERRLDRQVLSVSMGLVGYHLGERHAQALSRLFNETVADTAKQFGGRLIPVATVPMQSGRAAEEELEHAAKNLGIRMVEIGTNVNGANLDEDPFRGFFVRAAELGVLVQLHPHQDCVAGVERMSRYYLSNLIGNPVDTAVAAASLIFGGVMERLPSLKVCLVHGGGALPYLLGRLSHGHAHIEAARTVPRPPLDYFRRFYFDTIVHDNRALRLLHELVGSERLMIGTDFPYDHTGETDPIGQLERAGLAGDEKILGQNAAELLDLNK
jgi:aminocarboxymuconate-semialdehyde decarboxylase